MEKIGVRQTKLVKWTRERVIGREDEYQTIHIPDSEGKTVPSDAIEIADTGSPCFCCMERNRATVVLAFDRGPYRDCRALCREHAISAGFKFQTNRGRQR